MPPLKKEAYCFATISRYVGRSVPSVVRSISFDPFTWSIPNLVQRLPSMSRWSLSIFRSHVQRSRSNHSSQPTVLSAHYFFTPSHDQYQTWCRGCPQWVDDPYWFSGHMLKSQGQTTLEPSLLFTLYILIPCLLASDRFASTEDKPEFCTMGGIYVSETFLVLF